MLNTHKIEKLDWLLQDYGPKFAGKTPTVKPTAKVLHTLAPDAVALGASTGSLRESSNRSADIADVRRALTYIDADDYAQWIKIGMALKTYFGEEGFDLWDEWSKRSAKYGDDLPDKWKTFARDDGTGVSIGTIFHLAKQGGYEPKSINDIATDFAKVFGQGTSSFDDILSGEIDVPTFPCDALPEPFQAFVKNCAAVMQVQPELIIVHLLCVAASMLGRDFKIQPQANNQRWTEPAILWGMCVAESGAMKSPAAKEAVGFSQSLQLKFRKQYEHERSQYEFAEALRKDEGEGTELTKPKLETCYMSDATVESLKWLLSDDHNQNPRGILLYSDELAGWAFSLNQYKAGGNDRQVYLSLYDGGFFRVDRKKDGDPSIIDGTGLSICGGIQPHLLPKVFGNGDDGLTPRFQVVAYPKPYGKVGPSTLLADDAAKANVKQRLYEMREAQPLPSLGDGEMRSFGQPLRFDVEAQTFFDNYVMTNRNRHEVGIFAAHIEKQRGALARIAMVLHGMKHGRAMRDHAIGIDTIRAARDMINYFEAHARRLYGVTEAVDAKAGAMRIARWIKAENKTKFAAREVVRKDWKEFAKARNYETILASVEYLEAHGWLRLEHQAGGPRGQSGWTATVNPDVLSAVR